MVFANTKKCQPEKTKKLFYPQHEKKLSTSRHDLKQFDYICQIKISLMQTFGKIIKTAREKRKLYLRQVAAAIDIDQALISKFEKGDRKPSKEQVRRFATFFKLDENELIIAWKSDLVYYDLKDEKLANQILKIAEQKIDYLRQENNHKKTT